MSVRVRLTRVGSKKNPIWRVVVADQRSPRDGRFIETIGHYNPQTEPSTIRIDEQRLEHWLARGAQPSGTVKQLVKAYSKSGGAAAAATEAVPADEPAPDAQEPVEVGPELAEAEAAVEESEPAVEESDPAAEDPEPAAESEPAAAEEPAAEPEAT